MTIHSFGRADRGRSRGLLDLLARSAERDPSLAVTAYYAGDRRGPRVSFTIPGGSEVRSGLAGGKPGGRR